MNAPLAEIILVTDFFSGSPFSIYTAISTRRFSNDPDRPPP